MLKEIELYYFSPTGGTRKIGEIFAEAMAEKVKLTDLGETKAPVETPECEVVVAAPVFGGRIPAIVSERLGAVRGDGKKAVTLAVYGNRAYEDALLELNDVMEASGFQVIASGSFVAQHSIVPKVGAGRPDEKDMEELREFAEKVLDKLEAGVGGGVGVPGGGGEGGGNAGISHADFYRFLRFMRKMRNSLSHKRCLHYQWGSSNAVGKMYALYGMHCSLSGTCKDSSRASAGGNESEAGAVTGCAEWERSVFALNCVF